MYNFNNTNIVIIVFVSMKEAMIFNIRQLLVNNCMYLFKPLCCFISSIQLRNVPIFTGFVTRVTRRVPLAEQKLLTLSEHMCSPSQWGSCYTIFSFLCSVLQIILCPFVLLILAIVVSALSDLRLLITTLVSLSFSYTRRLART